MVSDLSRSPVNGCQLFSDLDSWIAVSCITVCVRHAASFPAHGRSSVNACQISPEDNNQLGIHSPGCVAQAVRAPSHSQCCEFDPGLGHEQESTNECINAWKNKFSLSLINENDHETTSRVFLSS